MSGQKVWSEGGSLGCSRARRGASEDPRGGILRQTSEAFPAGLYGMLLVAVFGLTLPSMFAPIERVLVGAAAIYGQ